MFHKWSVLFLTLVVAITLAIIAIKPPAPLGVDAPADQFSTARAMKDINIIASEPHPTGSQENARVRAYLVERLTALGMEVTVSESSISDYGLRRLNAWSGEDKSQQTLYNIIGTLTGNDRSKPALLLMAHHDTAWGSPGAADDSAGVAAILEIVRAMKEVPDRDRDLMVIFTDGEELNLEGARNFFRNNPLREKIGAVINFEARGSGGTANLFQTSEENGAVARLFARSVKEPSASSLSTYVYSVLPNDTDLTPALDRDYIAYNFAFIGRPQFYHSPQATPDSLDKGSVQHLGSQGLDLARALITDTDLPEKTPDVTFFDLFGLTTIVYAPYWGWVFLIVAAICFLISIRDGLILKEMSVGMAKMLGFLLVGGVLLYATNLLSGNDSSADYYDRLAATSRFELIALLVCFAVFLMLLAGKRLSSNALTGAAIPIFLLGILGQIYAPTATYFISLPLLLAGITSVILSRIDNKTVGITLTVISAAVVLGYMLSLGHQLILGVGQNMLHVSILPAAIAALAVLPLMPELSKRANYFLSLAGIVIAIAIALWVRLDPMASTAPVY